MEFNDKRVEKLVKKVRPFLDERQKPKARLQWLFNFIDTASVVDQGWLFKNFHNHVFQTLREGFARAVGKIRDASDRKLTITSKEICGLLRISALLRKIFLLIPNLIHTPEVYSDIEAILRSLLQHGNHPQLRLEGFRTFLCFLTTLGHSSERFSTANTVKTPANTELIPYLLGNAVLLDCFEPFELPSIPQSLKPPVREINTYYHVKQRPIEALDCFILLPSTSQLSASEMTDLLGEFLKFLVLCAEATALNVSPISLLNERYYSKVPSATSSNTFSFTKVPSQLLGGSKSGNSSNDSLSSTSASNLPSPVLVQPSALAVIPQSQAVPDPGLTPTDVSVQGLPKAAGALSPTGTQPFGSVAIHASQSEGVRVCGFLWELFVKYYLVHLLPLDRSDPAEFPSCPRPLLFCFLSFLKRLLPQESDQASPGGKLLVQLLLTSLSAVTFVHQVLQQSLLVPLDDKVDQSLALSAVELVEALSVDLCQTSERESMDSLSHYFFIFGKWSLDQQQSHVKWLQYHVKLLRYLFLPRKNTTGATGNAVWLEAIAFLERLVERMLENQWADLSYTIAETLLDIYDDLKPHIGDWFRHTLEILFVAVLFTDDAKLWLRLKQTLQRSMTDQVAWKFVFQSTTSLYAKVCFGVDLSHGPSPPTTDSFGVSPSHSLSGAQISKKPSNFSGKIKSDLLPNKTNESQGHPKGLAPARNGALSQKWLNHASLNWTPTTISRAWKNLLVVAGNPNGVSDPATHLCIVTTLVETLETLFIIRQLQQYESENVPNWFEFADWLFQIVNPADEEAHAKRSSVLATLGAICRVFSSRQEILLSPTLVSQFYLTVETYAAMSSETLSQILCNSVLLATSRLPGVHIPVKALLLNAKKFFDGFKIRELYHLTLLVGSFMTHPEIFKSCSSLILDVLTLTLSHCLLKSTLDQSANFSVSCQYASVASLASSVLSTFLLHLCTDWNEYPREPVNLAVDTLFQGLRHSHVVVVQAAAESLALLRLLKAPIAPNVLSKIQGSIKERISLGSVVGSYACVCILLQFAMDILLSKDASEDMAEIYELYSVVEALINENRPVSYLSSPTGYSRAPTPCSNGSAIPLSMAPLLYQKLSASMVSPTMSGASISGNGSLKRSPSMSTVSQQRDPQETAPQQRQPSETLAALEAAVVFLRHVTQFYQLFPLLPGDQTGGSYVWSEVSELDLLTDDGNIPASFLIVAAQRKAIVTVAELYDAEAQRLVTRWVVRNSAGRFVFDSHIANVKDDGAVSLSVKSSSDLALNSLLASGVTAVGKGESRLPEQAPADSLLELLKVIERDHPDCALANRESLLAPGPISKSLAFAGRASLPKGNSLSRVVKMEGYRSNCDASLSATSKAANPNATVPDVAKASKEFTNSRLLLTSLGAFKVPDELVSQSIFESKEEPSAALLRKSASLLRDLKGLDKRSTRETIKAAVLYVKLGQETEQAIVHNTEGSEAYRQFTLALGREVDVSTHAGYLGGLEKDGSNGQKVLYYSNSLVEMVFHDVTRMPNDADDPRQVRKKRHIGNDHVHIVWSEHFRDYKRDFIRGDFGNVAIVVHPLSDGRFSLKIWTSNHVVPFPIGPCVHQMIVPATFLGHLVRSSVIHAYRTCLASATMNAFQSFPASSQASTPYNTSTSVPPLSSMASHGTLGATVGAFDNPQLFSASSSYANYVVPFYMYRRPSLYAQRIQDLEIIIQRHAANKSECSLQVLYSQLFNFNDPEV